jgi:uncharacterized small protein (DUF1192 family)
MPHLGRWSLSSRFASAVSAAVALIVSASFLIMQLSRLSDGYRETGEMVAEIRKLVTEGDQDRATLRDEIERLEARIRILEKASTDRSPKNLLPARP